MGATINQALAAGWPTRMSRPFAAKGAGADTHICFSCREHVPQRHVRGIAFCGIDQVDHHALPQLVEA
jgi:hypothetical protein